MSMVKYIVILPLIVWLAIITLMPKQELYYKLEEILHVQDIELNEEVIEEGLFGLDLKNVSVYVKGINIANIDEVYVVSLLFYSRVEVSGLKIDDSLKSMVPQEIQKAIFTHSILSPLFIKIEAIGSFGVVHGEISLDKRKIHLDFNENKNIEMLKSHLKKSEEGWVYETSF